MRETVLEAIAAHRKLLAEFESAGITAVTAAAELLIRSIRGGGCVYLCGNGGSAMDAQHVAGELVGRFMRERKGLPAVALTADTGIVTAVGNDYSFETVFSRQVEALLKPGDVLWAFSTSGSSPNILAAADKARQQGGAVLAFTGKRNSKLEAMADVCLVADAPNSARAQEIHQIAYHVICELVERECSCGR